MVKLKTIELVGFFTYKLTFENEQNNGLKMAWFMIYKIYFCTRFLVVANYHGLNVLKISTDYIKVIKIEKKGW